MGMGKNSHIGRVPLEFLRYNYVVLKVKKLVKTVLSRDVKNI